MTRAASSHLATRSFCSNGSIAATYGSAYFEGWARPRQPGWGIRTWRNSLPACCSRRNPSGFAYHFTSLSDPIRARESESIPPLASPVRDETTYLLQLPDALHAIGDPNAESGFWNMQPPGAATGPNDSGPEISRIDYSHKDFIRVISYKSTAESAQWGEEMHRHVVLVGDIRDAAD